jgi:arylsulfatase
VIATTAHACAASASNTFPAPTAGWPSRIAPSADAPNIIIILLDDAGFAATSAFGGLVDMPTLDNLAADGLRYNQFNVTAVCSPTRAALLTGRNHHRVGFGTITEGPSAHSGYNTSWPKEAACCAEILRQSGYSTAAFGKWHNTPNWEVSPVGPFERWPTGLGFEHFYGFMLGETSQWEPPLWQNTTMVEPPGTPEQGYHVTSDLADRAIGWLQTLQSLAPDKPYLLYFSTGAPHKPHHAPSEWVARYSGRFDLGWDELRAEIFARQKRLGVIPASAALTSRPAGLPAWATLSDDEKRLAAHQMEIFAGFLSHTDHQIGRLLDVARRAPRGDNTLVLYVATDNGASGMDGLHGNDHTHVPPSSVQEQLLRAEAAAGPNGLSGYAAGWAWLNSTPFPWMKLIASHAGGTRAPLVVSWPSRIQDRGAIRTQFVHVTDIAPTLLELAGVEPPTAVNGAMQMSFDGVSFADTMLRDDIPSRPRTQYFENWGNRALYHNGWIAAQRISEPWSGRRLSETPEWELYDLTTDFSEAHDLSADFPEMLDSLKRLYFAEAARNGVLSLEQLGTSLPPSLLGHRTRFVYYPTLPVLLSATSAPDFVRPHRILARVIVDDSRTEGLIVSNGSRFGGFALFARDGRIYYGNNYQGIRHQVIGSTQRMPRGEHQIEIVVRGEITTSGELEGSGVLRRDGQTVGSGPLTIARPYYGTSTFNIGRARISPVTERRDLPFIFTGRILSVEIVLGSDS